MFGPSFKVMNTHNTLLSVVIPTHNPDPVRFSRVLTALRDQSLSKDKWELILVDNNSDAPIQVPPHLEELNTIVVFERRLGLTSARWRGISESKSDLVVLVDDDNVLCSTYLEEVICIFGRSSRIGAIGGKSIPEYSIEPPSWFDETMAPLGCRDLGDKIQIYEASDYARFRAYPPFSPIGAGMALRKQALSSWLDHALTSEITDRRGSSLSSAGDCDIVLHVLDAGWDIGYHPKLALFHLIGSNRVTDKYLQEISRAAFRDFIRVLDQHGIRPWSSIHPFTVPLRALKAWFTYQPWRSAERKLRWQSALGQYEGRALLQR